MTNRKIFYKEKMEVIAEIDYFVITAYEKAGVTKYFDERTRENELRSNSSFNN